MVDWMFGDTGDFKKVVNSVYVGPKNVRVASNPVHPVFKGLDYLLGRVGERVPYQDMVEVTDYKYSSTVVSRMREVFEHSQVFELDVDRKEGLLLRRVA
jgi:hypothetical protein